MSALLNIALDRIDELEATVAQLRELLDAVEEDLGMDYINALVERS